MDDNSLLGRSGGGKSLLERDKRLSAAEIRSRPTASMPLPRSLSGSLTKTGFMDYPDKARSTMGIPAPPSATHPRGETAEPISTESSQQPAGTAPSGAQIPVGTGDLGTTQGAQPASTNEEIEGASLANRATLHHRRAASQPSEPGLYQSSSFLKSIDTAWRARAANINPYAAITSVAATAANPLRRRASEVEDLPHHHGPHHRHLHQETGSRRHSTAGRFVPSSSSSGSASGSEEESDSQIKKKSEKDASGARSKRKSASDASKDRVRHAKRTHELDCIEFDKSGDFVARTINRNDILRYMRDMNDTMNEDINVDLAMQSKLWKKPKVGATKKRKAKVSRHYFRNGLQARDIRQVDPAFKAKPALWVRYGALVVSLEGYRAIIFHNRLLLFSVPSRDVENTINIIQTRLRAIMSSGTDTDDSDITPFEFKALEGLLIGVCLSLERDFVRIEPATQRILSKLGGKANSQELEELRGLELRLNHFVVRARGVQHILADLLAEDEEMANMYLTEISKNPTLLRNAGDHEEVEMLLESYLQVVDDLTSRAGLLTEAIDDAEGLLEIHLASIQNRLLLWQLFVHTVNMVISLATLGFDLFGMNFPLVPAINALPSGEYYFIGWVTLVFVFSCMILSLLIIYAKKQKLWGSDKSSSSSRAFMPSSKKSGTSSRAVEAK